MKRISCLLGLSALGALLAPACVYDPDQRCGPHQVEIDNDRCACEAGYVPGESGCVPCAEHELAVNGSCNCVEGYARPAEGEACEPIPTSLGGDCDTDSAPCVDESYPLCHPTEGTSGYCTSSCSDDADCQGGYACHADGADSYCRRPPLGYGKSCETSDDCADGEATYCEALRTHTCIVPCQAGRTDVCFEGEVCCDFAIFEPVCVPAAACEANGTELP